MKKTFYAILGAISVSLPCLVQGQTLYWRTVSGTWSNATTSPTFNWAATSTGTPTLDWTSGDSAEITTTNPSITLSGTVNVNMLTVDAGAALKGTSVVLNINGGGSGNLSLAGTTALDVFLNGTSAWSGTLATSSFPGRYFLENSTATSTATKFNLSGGGRIALDAGTIGQTVVIGELSSGTSSSTVSIGSATLGTRTLDVDQSTNTTFAGAITDGAASTARYIALVKSGTGTLALTDGASTYVGGTTITDGVLSISTLANGGVVSSIGSGSNLATNLVLNGGSLRYVGAATTTDHLFSIGSSGGTIDASGSGAVAFTNTGTIASNGQSGVRTLALTGSSTDNNSLAGKLVDTGGATSVAKSGNGRWILTGSNSYSGATTITAGTLLVNGNQSGATGLVTVSSGATLGGVGTVGGATSVDGTLSAGQDGPGTLNFVSSLTLNSTSQSLFDVSGTTEGTQFDSIHVTGNMVYGGALDINLGFTFTGSQTFQLFTVAGTESGAFSSVQISDSGYTGSFDATTGILTASAVPEPSPVALGMVGLLGCGAMMIRWRRRNTLSHSA